MPTADCEHVTKGRRLAHALADLASLRESALLAGATKEAVDLKHSYEMTKLAIHWNYQDHQKECEE